MKPVYEVSHAIVRGRRVMFTGSLASCRMLVIKSEGERIVRVVIIESPRARGRRACAHGEPPGECAKCDPEAAFGPAHERSTCPHGNRAGECSACDEAGDHAFDAAREQSFFGGR